MTKIQLPSPFTFSQSSLQDYNDCPRRFQLRYIDHLAWPAVETEPTQDYERHQQEGSLFHRMVQQHILGIPTEKLSALANSENLSRWWNAYQKDFGNIKDSKNLKLYPEYSLSAPIGEHRIVAKFDTIAIEPGKKAIIYDWKTYRKRPRDEYLATRWQTRLYTALLVRAGKHLNNDISISPEQIEMVYWFSNFSNEPAKFSYSEAKYKRDWALVEKIVDEISSASKFPMSEDEHPCKFCAYRSYCDRGKKAGEWDDFDGEIDVEESFEIDFEQIGEIAF
ncbi:MAG: PD-(D/E)XK nuclease family protein [Chloroflexi bacterium]|nr:PD-(D/E)XK nuclease family protein [Chloroflexota bacterium]